MVAFSLSSLGWFADFLGKTGSLTQRRKEEKRRRDLIAALLPFRLWVERLQILHIFNIIIPILVR